MNTQAKADELKAILYAYSIPLADVDLKRLEGAGWHDAAWDDAVDETEGLIVGDDNRLMIEPSADVIDVVNEVISRFLVLSGQLEVPCLYNVQEAALYLGLTPRTVTHHHHKSGKLRGQVVRGIFFTQQQLDDFKANPPQPGRPPAE